MFAEMVAIAIMRMMTTVNFGFLTLFGFSSFFRCFVVENCVYCCVIITCWVIYDRLEVFSPHMYMLCAHVCLQLCVSVCVRVHFGK